MQCMLGSGISRDFIWYLLFNFIEFVLKNKLFISLLCFLSLLSFSVERDCFLII